MENDKEVVVVMAALMTVKVAVVVMVCVEASALASNCSNAGVECGRCGVELFWRLLGEAID